MAQELTIEQQRKHDRIDARAARAYKEAQKCLNCTLPAHRCIGGSVGTCGITGSDSRMTMFIQDSCGFAESAGLDMVITDKEYKRISRAAERNGISRRKLTQAQR